MKSIWLLGAAACVLAACSDTADHGGDHQAATAQAEMAAMQEPVTMQSSAFEEDRLTAILTAQPDEVQARYQYRHPVETLEFFGIAPGMKVVELLPGRGWYTKILLPYLGKDGGVIAAGYPEAMLAPFGPVSEERLATHRNYPATWPEMAAEWVGGEGGSVAAFNHGALPDDLKGTADAVFLIRGLHHLNRFDVANFEGALQDYKDILKAGGVVGVVQHRAPEDADDKWANGDNGYLKQSLVIERFTEAGFEFVGTSEINANAKDRPVTGDSVWRLPPTLATSRENPELKAEMEEIGESDRMTLLFRKP